MTPVKYNIKFRRGADWNRIFTHRTPVTNAPHDLTGCTARMQVRSETGSNAVLDELTTENGRLVIVNRLIDPANPLSGSIPAGVKMIFPNAISSAFVWDDGVFDLEIVRPSGEVGCMIETSKIELTGEVTRP